MLDSSEDKSLKRSTQSDVSALQPVAIQVDIDGLWAVRECYGQSVEHTLVNDPVYEEAVPSFLNLLDEFNLLATFFVVGKDAEIPEKKNLLQIISERGHEIANHGYSHVLGLSAARIDKIADEIVRTQDAIHAATGKYPVGFRAPGYDINEQILHVLRELGFAYDSSLFPTPFSFAFRLADRYLSFRLRTHKRQFGRLRNSLAPLSPYFPHPDNLLEKISQAEIHHRNNCIFEIPVSVSPFLRLPMHCGVAMRLGFDYFKRCAKQLMKHRLPLIYVFHGVDLLDTAKHPIFPGAKRGKMFFPDSYKKKEQFVRSVLGFIASRFRPVLSHQLVEEYYPKS